MMEGWRSPVGAQRKAMPGNSCVRRHSSKSRSAAAESERPRRAAWASRRATVSGLKRALKGASFLGFFGIRFWIIGAFVGKCMTFTYKRQALRSIVHRPNAWMARQHKLEVQV